MRGVLIANRGEIALRVMRACHELGLTTVAVYDEADRGARHVAYATRSCLVAPGPTGRAYLHGEALIAAALESGADAIHPGYGFLAENAAFATAVIAAGLTWIGPPPPAIAVMGDKVAARALAEMAGVPVVPGSPGPVDDVATVQALAERWGYPVAIKAAGGGGGRGFRVARQPEEVAAALEGASREAAQFFANPAVYVEKYIERPRHIEVQVLADHHGHLLHLGERDCSIQRRHQKLVEEAPSPAVDAALRARLGETALRLARAADYGSAGTVEFLLAPDGAFYFLEMNTRIQVEHTVTEMVTGIDLVKEQLRIAAGEPLGYDQAAIEWRGHAIEVRLNAEDAAADFRPTPGLITAYREPTGFGVRVDSAVIAGDSISPRYDSLIAKLIVWGRDRTEALGRLGRALSDFQIEGVPTTLPFHQRLLTHPVFRAGQATTDFIEREAPMRGVAPAAPATEPPADSPPTAAYLVEVNGRRFDIRLFEPAAPASGPTGRATPQPQRPSTARRASGATTAPGQVISPLQGTVVKVAVSQGQRVAAGELLLVIEAMKMENEITAPTAGEVVEVTAVAGATVQVGASLLRLG